MWLLRVGAGNTHSVSAAARRDSRIAAVRCVNGIVRRAFSVLPNGMWTAPSCTYSHRRRKHSSGRRPQSIRIVVASLSRYGSRGSTGSRHGRWPGCHRARGRFLLSGRITRARLGTTCQGSNVTSFPADEDYRTYRTARASRTPRTRRQDFSAPISHGNWRSKGAIASAAVSGLGAGTSPRFGAACAFRIRRFRAWPRPPRAPILRHWSIVLLNRIGNGLSFRMTIH